MYRHMCWFILLLFAASACGSREEEFDLSLVFGTHEVTGEHTGEAAAVSDVFIEDGFDWQKLYDFDRNVLERSGFVASPFYGETLTIFIERNWHRHRNMAQIANSFERMHPGVNVEFVFSDTIETEDFHDLMEELMTEHAPDIIQASNVFYPGHENTYYFVDWMPVLARHPGFDTNDWNMNVLTASFINGELIAFPSVQVVFFVSANRTVPGLADMFEIMESITIKELLDLYDGIWGYADGLAFLFVNLTGQVILFHLHEFFDYETGRVEFNTDEFIDLLERLYYTVHMLEEEAWEDWQHRLDIDIIFSEHYFFRYHGGFMDFEVFLLLEHEPYFVNPLPIVTNDGALKVSAFTGNHHYSWILSTQNPASQALAAEFLLFMAGVFGQGVDSRNSPFYASSASWGLFGVPARLDGFSHGADVVRNFVHMFPSAPWRQDAAYAADIIEEHILHLKNMEMQRLGVFPRSFFNIFVEELDEFSEGIVSARETATRLQNRVMSELGDR